MLTLLLIYSLMLQADAAREVYDNHQQIGGFQALRSSPKKTVDTTLLGSETSTRSLSPRTGVDSTPDNLLPGRSYIRLKASSSVGSRIAKKEREEKFFRSKFQNPPSTWLFEWMASLRTEADEHICGGSLIAPQVVLTAAHCLNNTSTPFSPVSVDLGRNRRAGNDDSGFQKYGIMNSIIHEDYSPKNDFDNDIALIVLDSPTIRQHVQLANNSDCFQSEKGCKLKALGWGILDYDKGLAEELRVVSPPTVTKEACREHRLGQVITDNMLCAGNITEGGIGNCIGDSGGPAFIRQKGMAKQVGIVSWSHGCGDAYSPEVLVSVPELLPWIEEKLSTVDAALTRDPVQ